MLVEWIMKLGADIAAWFAGIFPVWVVPDQLMNVDDALNGLFAGLSGFGPWVDWAFVATVAAIPLGVWAVGLLVKISRAALAHIPWIGGKG